MNTSRTLIRFAFAAVIAVAPLAAGCNNDDPTTGDEQNVTSDAGKFETFKGADGKYYFHLLAGNYEKVLQSQAYSSKAAAKKGIDSVKTNAVDSTNFKVLKATNGEYYFNLVAANGEIIGTSETYESKTSAKNGANGVKALVSKQLRIEAAQTGGAKFTVFTGSDGDSYFNLRAANGEIVLASEGYVDEEGALGAIDSVRTNGTTATQYEVLQTSSGQAYFHLKASNGEIIGVSEMYASLSNAQRGMDTVRTLIASQKVADPE